MGLYTNQENERTELQKKIAEHLNDKAKKTHSINEDADMVEDSAYIEGTKKTTSLAWIWAIIVLAAVGIAFWLMATGLEHQK